MNRRTTAAICLGAAPILITASHFLWPAHSEGTDAQQIAAAGAHAGAWAAATVVETLGWVVFVPALIGLWSAVSGRGRRMTTIGVWLSIAGMFGYYGAGIMNVVSIELGRRHDPVATAALAHALKHNGTLFLLLVAPLLLGTLALILTFVGVARAKLVGWWAPVAVFVGIAASQVLSSSENAILLALAFAPVTAACLVMANNLSRLSTATVLPEPALVAA
jgi:hypothetical protein